ncbi:MAG: HD domain-containing phosphohydrolase [Chloroflexota bacterium]
MTPCKPEPPDVQHLLSVLERANQIASLTTLDDLLDRMLDLVIEVAGGEAGTLYLLDELTGELVFKVVKGGTQSHKLAGKRLKQDHGIVGAAIQQARPIIVDDLAKDKRWHKDMNPAMAKQLHNAITIPLLREGKPIGAIQIFNFTHPELEMLQVLGNRMASEVEKAILLEENRQRNERLQALIEIIGQIGSTLDRDRLLRLIIQFASELLDVEACSLFLVDPETEELILHMSSQKDADRIEQARVPAGKGIIGEVVKKGNTILVEDTRKDKRHYRAIDDISGFTTRSILAVPLWARTISLGQQRGMTKERIIGGIEAINKRSDIFHPDDKKLLETLANQAATVLQIAELFADANDLFLDTTKALTAAIDAKDPYTQGHSQRVSEFSALIAQELNLDPETIHHIRIGSLLHDVGKIGVPDEVLKKPGPLTEKEFENMQYHTTIGKKIMSQVRKLKAELTAMAEHHERLNGSGYPLGLQGEQISLMGRIVAVADVFDALTSYRQYRKALNAEEALDYLVEKSNSVYDESCVQALILAYQKGKIHPQYEQHESTGDILLGE